jgi:diguanylate cyclase (GGDEF)-like protein
MAELFGQSETKRLRSRLLIGSVAIAVVASVVFLAIAYRLAVQFGTDLNQDSVSTEANCLLQALEISLTSTEETRLTGVKAIPSDALNILHPERAFLQIRANGSTLETGGLNQAEFDLAAILAHHDAGTQSGLFTTDAGRFIWAWLDSPDNGAEVLLVRQAASLDSGLHLLSRRLALASTLILWLAAWAALIISGVIAKRFNSARERLVHEATHDALTGLGNRIMFLRRYSSLIDQRQVGNGLASETLIMLDLDNFKEVNDTAGPDIGDQLLVRLSQTIQAALPPGAELFRYGGDEFAIWLGQSDESHTRQWAEKLVELSHQTITIDDWSFGIGASAGVARLPEDGVTLKDLLRCADIALHQAKRLRTGVSFFTSSKDPDKELKIELRSQLHQAIADHQFVLFYQPKVNLQDHRIRGVEALARWMHPIHGLLAPYLFIDLVEQGGVVNLFSRYVLRQAIGQLRVWLDHGIEVPIAVNLSSYNLLDVKLVDYIRETLAELHVPGRLLEIELTESAAMFDVTLAQDIFSQLHPDGVKVSIDDFGTGMSSLAHLKSLDVEYIKIDRSFISRLEHSETDQAIVACMIDLCHNLQKQVIAEGVETAEQAAMLLKMGCNQAQGYIFSRPVPAENLRLTEKLGMA